MLKGPHAVVNVSAKKFANMLSFPEENHSYSLRKDLMNYCVKETYIYFKSLDLVQSYDT